MFTRQFVSVAAVVSLVAAGPLAEKRQSSVITFPQSSSFGTSSEGFSDFFNQIETFTLQEESVSLTTVPLTQFAFNTWGGFSDLNGFDSFFNVGNFDGRFNQIQFIEQEQQIEIIQCETIEVNIVQQYLSVLIESMKELILISECDVEIQTIISEQFISRMNVFVDDVRRISGRGIGYDSQISSFLPNVASGLQSRNFQNLGFNGLSIGSHQQFVSSNWDVQLSPSRVHAAWQASQLALLPAGLQSQT